MLNLLARKEARSYEVLIHWQKHVIEKPSITRMMHVRRISCSG
jgi:hypothetical protein